MTILKDTALLMAPSPGLCDTLLSDKMSEPNSPRARKCKRKKSELLENKGPYLVACPTGKKRGYILNAVLHEN